MLTYLGCYNCQADVFPSEDGERMNPQHWRRHDWPSTLTRVYLDGALVPLAEQASDGETPWVVRIHDPAFNGHAINAVRCSCGSGRPMREMVYGNVTIDRPTRDEVRAASRS